MEYLPEIQNLSIGKSKESEALLIQAENDFNPTGRKNITLRETEISTNTNNSKENVSKLYGEMSLYNGPEFENDTTSFFEKEIDKVLVHANRLDLIGKIRVVILTRSDELSAFALPDKTIVITQRFINECQKLDLVMGIILHELTHILNDDFKSFNSVTDFISNRYFQEKFADASTPGFLEHLGLNTTGLESALMLLEKSIKDPSRRNIIYSELSQRQLEINTQHRFVHRENSTKKLTDLDPIFLKPHKLTNKEIFQKLKEKKDIKTIRSLLPLLSVEQLMQFYREDLNQGGSNLFVEFMHLFKERLREINFTEDQINYFLFCFTNTPTMIKYSFFSSTKELLKLLKNVDDLEGRKYDNYGLLVKFNFRDGVRHLYQSNQFISGDDHIFLEQLNRNIIHEDKNKLSESERQYGSINSIPINNINLIKILEEYYLYISNLVSEYNLAKLDKLNESILHNYLYKYVKNEGEVEQFLTLIKNSKLKITFNEKYMKSLLHVLDQELHEFLIKRVEELFGFKFEVEKKEYKIETKDYSLDAFKEKLAELQKKGIKEIKDTLIYSTFIDEYLTFFYREKYESVKKQYLDVFFEFIDNLPFDTKEFFLSEKDCYLLEFIKFGKDFDNKELPELTPEYLKKTKQLAAFNLKISYLLFFYHQDNENFYKEVNKLMKELPIKIELLTESQFYRLLSPLINIDSNSFASQSIIFGFGADNISLLDYNVTHQHFELGAAESNWSFYSRYGTLFQNIDKLEQTPYFDKFLKIRESNKKIFNSLEEIEEEYKKLNEEYKNTVYPLILSRFRNEDSMHIFDENLYNVLLFKNIRESFLIFLQNIDIEKVNTKLLYELVKKILPNSVKKDEILREIKISFIYGNSEFDKKVKFLEENYQDFTYQDIVSLVEEIDSKENIPGEYWKNWEMLKSVYEKIKKRYETGQDSSKKLTVVDYASSLIGTHYSDFILQSVENSRESSYKLSTKLALEWSKKNFVNKSSEEDTRYEKKEIFHYFNAENKKFISSSNYREMFISVKDIIVKLKNLPNIQRFELILKSLIAQNGLLSSKEKRDELGEIITSSLKLNSGFTYDFIQTFVKKSLPGTEIRNQLITLLPHVLSKKLFSALDTSEIHLDTIIKKGLWNLEEVKNDVTEDDLKNIFESDSRDILVFGNQFFNSKSKFITSLVLDSDRKYYSITKILENLYSKRDIKDSEIEKQNLVPENTEILINLLEQSVLGVRGMQIASQLRNFSDKGLTERMGRSFDANPGMDKLRFLIALDSAAEKDPKLLEFLRTKLVKINKMLGGGSMASTYSADVIEDLRTGVISKNAIRGLIPGAELEIEKVGNTILEVLEYLKENGKETNDSKLMFMVTKLAIDWCIRDITDPKYEENDDIFRKKVIEEFNKFNSEAVFVAPERILTSRKNYVRIEDLAQGVSIREFLENQEVSKEFKKEVLKQVYLFNRFQFSKSNIRHKKALVQSDPSIGNYLVKIDNGKPIISVLDRGFMLEISEERVNLVESLFKGEYKEFLNNFIREVVESNIENNERFKVLNGTLKKIVKKNLEITIMSKFFLKYTFGKKENKENLMITINEILIDHKLEIPLELQLIIKNVLGLEKLMLKYQGETNRKTD